VRFWEGFPRRALVLKLPAVTGWQSFGDPRQRSRKRRFLIEPECVKRLEVQHDFRLES
jgi:hypothetical protein